LALTESERLKHNAAAQQRWRERNQIALTGSADEIADRLMGTMAEDNPVKLRQVAGPASSLLQGPTL
jgi:hypothetical protein